MLQKHRGEALNLARPEFINSDRGAPSDIVGAGARALDDEDSRRDGRAYDFGRRTD